MHGNRPTRARELNPVERHKIGDERTGDQFKDGYTRVNPEGEDHPMTFRLGRAFRLFD